MEQKNEYPQRGFPAAAGFFLGLGMGGFFDGIILHQVLQWHHMLTSAGYPADNLRNLQINTLWDGLFHLFTYIFVNPAIKKGVKIEAKTNSRTGRCDRWG